MNTIATYIPYAIFFLIGIAIGGLIEHALKGRSTPSQPDPTSNNKLAGTGDVEVFGAWRTGSNRVWLEMDGKRVENKEALLPEQRQRLLNLVLDLRPWLETARPVAPAPEVPVQPVQNMISKSALEGGEPTPEPALESIIEQINKVLQIKLANSVFIDRGIQLTEGPGGIVIIKDGVNRYEGIEAVPDLQIKTLIQQAVTDWEKGTK
jgi:hypothetical protein